jgi:hypothetical protein
VVKVLREEKRFLEGRLTAVEKAILALTEKIGKNAMRTFKRRVKKARTMSEATKAKIRKSAKARWAKIKKNA